MLTNQQKLGLSVLNHGFAFMCPPPFGWDLDKGCFFRKPTFWRLFFGRINHAFILLLCLSDMYVLGTHFFGHKRISMEFPLTVIAMYICAIVTNIGAILISVTVLAHLNHFGMANDTLQFLDWAIQKYHPRKTGDTFLDKLVIPISVTAILGPWGIFTLIPLNLDPGYFIVDDYLVSTGSSRYDRTGEQIFLSLPVRVIFMLGVFETSRILGLVAVSGLILAHKARQVVEIASSRKAACHEIMWLYRIWSILYPAWAPSLNPIISIGFSGICWVLVIVWWIVLKKFEETPLVPYMVVTAFSLTITFALFLGLKLASRVGETVDMILERCRVTNSLKHAGTSLGYARWLAKIRKLEAKAMRRIILVYYPFMVMDKEFVMATMETVVDSLLDALLLF